MAESLVALTTIIEATALVEAVVIVIASITVEAALPPRHPEREATQAKRQSLQEKEATLPNHQSRLHPERGATRANRPRVPAEKVVTQPNHQNLPKVAQAVAKEARQRAARVTRVPEKEVIAVVVVEASDEVVVG